MLLSLVFVFLLLTRVSGSDNGTDSTPEVEKAILSCKCGESAEEFRRDIDLSTVADILNGIIKSRSINFFDMLEYPQMIKEYLMQCSKCEVLVSMCSNDPNKKDGHICNKGTLGFWIPINGTAYEEYKSTLMYIRNQISSLIFGNGNKGKPELHVVKREVQSYPIHVHIPLGGLNRRVKRHREACHYPTSLQTSQLDCTLYQSGAKCTQTCGYGYTLPEGPKVQYSCKNKENKWHPKNFRECRPFIDCTVTLVSGGSAKCKTPSVKSPPVCEIKCEKYEDKDAVKSRKYTCNMKGIWKPHLPFCAVPGSGLELAKRPNE